MPRAGEGYKAYRARFVAAGRHPLRGDALGPAGETCGTCCHCRAMRYAGTYWKCEIGPLTHGPSTDIRKSWPACERWQPVAGAVGP